MRTLGLCASILAAAQLLLVTSPALADEKAPPAKSEAAAPAPVSTTPAGTVMVHIDAPLAVSLARREAGSTRFEPACVSPCDQAMPIEGEYQITGGEMSPSKPFLLDAKKGKVVLTVSPGTAKKQKIGLYTLIGSGVLFVGGALVTLIGANAKTNASGEIPQSNTGTIFVGEIMMLTGVVGGIFGGAWYLDNRTTGVDGDVGKTIPEKSGGAPGGAVQVKVSASREPVFSAPKPTGLPAFTTVPIYSGTF
jgi:hypothetical protein